MESAQSISPDEIRELIKALLVEEFDIEPDQIVDSAKLEDFDLSSLDLIEIGQLVDHKYGVRIKASDAEGITDLGGVISMVTRKVNEKDLESEASTGAASTDELE